MGHAAKLCRIVEGVEFVVREQGVRIHALILRDALEVFFGAGASPESWLLAYTRHRNEIDCAAIVRFWADFGPAIVVLTAERPEDFTIGAPARCTVEMDQNAI